ncbi:phosphotransferase [Agrilactobacillus yilanensis]|uniref:Phosphotransferase n=1 Tax=Agrilactobacillus yilanensis TaxID=2485997 RepID=A0ABW4JB71_9LACO|nr:aminoglycoside phosphotransferase family protein [Agrilactobacillus yilanensis]
MADLAKLVSTYVVDRQLMAKLHYQPLDTVTFLAQGEYNRNFLLTTTTQEKLVFRINYGSQINVVQQARYEYEALQLLKPSQRTPEPLYLDDTRTFFEQDIMIETFLPGQPLNYQRDLQTAAEIFAAIHNLPVTPQAYQALKTETKLCTARLQEADELLQPVKTTDKLAPAEIQLLLALRQWCDTHNADAYFAQQPQCLVNTEVNANNFLITPTTGYLIDWEKPVISNSVQDLTQFMVETTTLFRTTTVLTPAEVTGFLTRYSQLTQQPMPQLRANIAHYMPFLLLRALSWCGMLVATYDQKPIQNVEILHKCQSFLQVDFAKPLLAKYGVIL